MQMPCIQANALDVISEGQANHVRRNYIDVRVMQIHAEGASNNAVIMLFQGWTIRVLQKGLSDKPESVSSLELLFNTWLVVSTEEVAFLSRLVF